MNNNLMKRNEKRSEKRRDVPKGVVIILLVAIILISAINTFAILNFVNNAKAETTAQVTSKDSEQGGIIKLTLIEPPREGEGNG